MRVVGAWGNTRNSKDFCQRTGLQSRTLREVARLRQQLTNLGSTPPLAPSHSLSSPVNTMCSDVNLAIDPELTPPTGDQACLLRQIILSGLGDHVARKIATDKMAAEDKRRLRFSYQVYRDPLK